MFKFIFAFLVAFICFNVEISSFPFSSRSKEPSLRIYGGQQAAVGQFPFQVAFQQSFKFENFTESIHFCTGSILNENWILTSASCVYEDSDNGLEGSSLVNVSLIIGGQQSLNTGAIYEIDQVVLHPEFEGEPSLYEHNIALVKTTQPIEFNEQVQPIELSANEVNENVVAQVSGWVRIPL